MSYEKIFMYVIGIAIFLNSVVGIWVYSFATEDVQAFLENPNFSPVSTPIYDHSLLVSYISNVISHGFPVNLFQGYFFELSFSINPFSLFGVFPDNPIQDFISQNIASLTFLPPIIAMPFLILTLASLFFILVSIALTLIKLIPGI